MPKLLAINAKRNGFNDNHDDGEQRNAMKIKKLIKCIECGHSLNGKWSRKRFCFSCCFFSCTYEIQHIETCTHTHSRTNKIDKTIFRYSLKESWSEIETLRENVQVIWQSRAHDNIAIKIVCDTVARLQVIICVSPIHWYIYFLRF